MSTEIRDELNML